MKYLVQQLQKYQQQPLVVDEQLDLSAAAKENFSDRLLDLKVIHATGEISYEKGDQIKVDLLLVGTAVLPSARSAKAVDYPFKVQMNELYVQDEASLKAFDQTEQVFLIEKNQLDLDAAILENIITNLPMTVYAADESAEQPLSGGGWQLISEEDYVEPESHTAQQENQSLGDFFPDNSDNNKDR
ncbi:hypothetical protein OAL24_00279 [Oenococcus sicerae]|nr:hypothetical protein OAL24_00279 [Oenococcus sicerae]